MAALRGVMDYDHHARQVSRLAHQSLSARLSTWRTHVNVQINRFGQVDVSVERDGSIVKRWKFEKSELSKKDMEWLKKHEERKNRRLRGEPSAEEIDQQLEEIA